MRQHTRTDWPDDWVLSLRRFGRSQGSPWTHTRTFTSLRPRPACLAPKIVCVFFFLGNEPSGISPTYFFFSWLYFPFAFFFSTERTRTHTRCQFSSFLCCRSSRAQNSYHHQLQPNATYVQWLISDSLLRPGGHAFLYVSPSHIVLMHPGPQERRCEAVTRESERIAAERASESCPSSQR